MEVSGAFDRAAGSVTNVFTTFISLDVRWRRSLKRIVAHPYA
jgi:hypothetical protein